jgi:hypothetical protein
MSGILRAQAALLKVLELQEPGAVNGDFRSTQAATAKGPGILLGAAVTVTILELQERQGPLKVLNYRSARGR